MGNKPTANKIVLESLTSAVKLIFVPTPGLEPKSASITRFSNMVRNFAVYSMTTRIEM